MSSIPFKKSLIGFSLFLNSMPNISKMYRMNKYIPASMILMTLMLSACCSNEKEQELITREQALLEKEKMFAAKDAEYQILLRMRDSILSSIKDTPAVYMLPETIVGQWSSKVVCTESGCPDYVIGDQRTDIWEFINDSTRIIVKNINNNNVIRVYSGTYDGNLIHLAFKTDSTAEKQVEMNVWLNDIKESKIRGVRNVVIDNKCTAKFSVDLDRIKTKGQ
jgi:hypothetical protein